MSGGESGGGNGGVSGGGRRVGGWRRSGSGGRSGGGGGRRCFGFDVFWVHVHIYNPSHNKLIKMKYKKILKYAGGGEREECVQIMIRVVGNWNMDRRGNRYI